MATVNQTLYEHADYRAFLRSRHAEASQLSLAGLGRKLGMSKMAVKYLLDGRRHLAEARVDTVARVFGLTGADADYFRCLVSFGKAKSDRERSRWFQAMLAIKGSPFRERVLGSGEIDLLGHWTLPAIVEMSYLRGFEPRASWIRPRL